MSANQYTLRFHNTTIFHHFKRYGQEFHEFGPRSADVYSGPRTIELVDVEANNLRTALLLGWQKTSEWDTSQVASIEYWGPVLPIGIPDERRDLQNRFYNALVEKKCVDEQLKNSNRHVAFPGYLSRDCAEAKQLRVDSQRLQGKVDVLKDVYLARFGTDMPSESQIYVSEFVLSSLQEFDSTPTGIKMREWLDNCDYESMANWVADTSGLPVLDLREGQTLSETLGDTRMEMEM